MINEKSRQWIDALKQFEQDPIRLSTARMQHWLFDCKRGVSFPMEQNRYIRAIRTCGKTDALNADSI
jgi:hypothetical protein